MNGIDGFSDTKPRIISTSRGPRRSLPIKRTFTLLELLTVMATLAVLAAIALPAVYDMQLRAKEAEIRPNTESILDALIAFQLATDNDIDVIAFAPGTPPGKQQQAFTDTSGAFANIGWHADGDLYGVYSFRTTGSHLPRGNDDCMRAGTSGANARDGGVHSANPLYVFATQDLDGDGNTVNHVACETTPGTLFPIEIQGRTGKFQGTYTGVGPYSGDW